MKKFIGVLLCALSFAQAAGYEMKSYVALGGKTQPAFAWCDASDRVFAVPQVAGPLTQPQPARLLTWLKKGSVGPKVSSIQLGAGDGAAGSVFYPLGRNGDYLRLSNVENTNDPAYRLSRVSSFKVGGKEHPCRYVKDAVFIGVTNKRTVIIWDNGRAATYATRNFDGSAGVYVTGGKVNFDDLGREYTFAAPDDYTYLVLYHEYSAFLQVKRGEKVLLEEPFVAYSFSRPQ